MPLEAVLLCVDNSEYMRNGDYSPTRLVCQSEAVSRLCHSIIENNLESVMGLLSMAGKRIQTHVSLSRNVGIVMKALHEDVKCGGNCNIVGSLKTAQLALKNRLSKNQHQRIILFVGSPVTHTDKELTKVGKLLKKNNVALDIINFGTENTNEEDTNNVTKLQLLIDTVNSGENSHLVSIPPSAGSTLMENVMRTPIAGQVAPQANMGGGFAGADVNLDEYGGIDPNLDPEMALAIRMSMEEARAREEAEAKNATEASTTTTNNNNETTNNNNNEIPSVNETSNIDTSNDIVMDFNDEEDEDMLLQQAIALSMAADNVATNVEDNKQEQEEQLPPGATSTSNDINMDNDDVPDISDTLNDPDFIASLLDSAGVDKDELKMDDIFGTDDKDKKKDKDKK